MKYRFAAFLLALLLAGSMVAGCAAPQKPGETTTPGQTTTPPPQTTETVPPTEPPVVTEPDIFTKHGEPELPGAAELPPYAQATDTPYLYLCDIDLPQKFDYTVEVHSDILHFYSYGESSFSMRMYSLTTGEFIHEVDLSSYGMWGVLEDGGLWMVDPYEMRAVACDASGNETLVLDRSGETQPERSPLSVAITEDGKYLLARYDTGDIMELYDLTTGQMRLPQLPEQIEEPYLRACGNKFLLVDYDNYTEGANYFLNPEDMSVEYAGPAEGEGVTPGELRNYYYDGALVFGDGLEDSPRFFMPVSREETYCGGAFGCAIMQNYGENSLRFYDLRNARFLGEVVMPWERYNISAMFLSSGAVLITAFGDDGVCCYLYDLPALAAENSGETVETFCMTTREMEQETARIADEVMERTGVELLYGSAGNDFAIFDYVGVAELDPFTVYYAVSRSRDILMKYPEGMLREAYELTHNGLRIYLCAEIYGIQSSALGTAGGVTTDMDGYIIIAVDVGNNLNYDLPHELSHAFDRRISYIDSVRGTTWMQDWENATPIPDCYANTYKNYGDLGAYTAAEHREGEEVWFVDSYSRTFPTEDRARIMENLFNMDREFSAELFRHENLLYKARLYSYILRQCFPSCAVPEVLYWETGLGDMETWNIPQG